MNPQVSLRPITNDDTPALLELWNRSVEFDQVNERLFREKVWGDPGFHLSMAMGAAIDHQLVGFSTAVVRSPSANLHSASDRLGYLKMLVVAPEHRQQRIGTQLYEQLQREIIGQGATEIRVAESAPNYLTPGVDERLATMQIMLLSQGFEPVGEAINQRVDLKDFTAVSSTNRPHKFLIQRLTEELTDSLNQLINRHWPSWCGEVAVALQAKPATLFVAVDQEQVVGFAAYEANNLGTGWFGPMGTDPDYQSQGIGRALLEQTLAQMAAEGFAEAIIPWVGPSEFYAKTVGAVFDRRFRRYKKKLAQ